MSARPSILEKHDGALDSRTSVRIWLRMLSCTMTIEKQVQRRLNTEFGTTLPRFDVMAALDRAGGGVTMSALSRALLVSNGNVTAIVQSLLRDGHVVTSPHPTDGRSLIVRMTPAGRRHFCEMSTAHHGWIEDLFSSLGEDERDALFLSLDHLKSSLGEAARKGTV